MSALPMRRIDAPRRRHSRDFTDGLQRRLHGGGRGRRARGAPLARRDGFAGLAEAARAAGSGAERPLLSVVPRRRTAANVAAVLVVVVGVLMLFAIVLQTRTTERQATIDRLEQQVADEHARFEKLRGNRALLLSPVRLAEESNRLAMTPPHEAGFVTIDPMALARVLAATGLVDRSSNTVRETDPLDQVRRVRAAESGVELDDLGRLP